MPWDSRERALAGLLHPVQQDLDKELAYWQGVELSGFSVSKLSQSWRCVLRGVRKRTPVVAFVEGPTLPALHDHIVWAATSQSLRWYPDRYADKRG